MELKIKWKRLDMKHKRTLKLSVLLIMVTSLIPCFPLFAVEPIVNVKTETVEKRDLIKYSDFTGFLEPVNKTTVSAEVSGIIELVRVKLGDSVKKGDILVRISTKDLEIDKEKAESNFALKKMLYEQEKEIFETRINDVKLTKKEKDRFPENLITQNALLTKRQAQSAYKLALNNYNREKSLSKKGFSNASRLETVENQMLSTKFQFQLADIAYERVLRQANVSVQTAKNNMDSALATLRSINRSIEKSIIKASYDGIIGDIPVHEGELINKSAKILDLVDTSLLKAVIFIGENNIRKVSVGQIVDIYFDSIAGEVFKGTIRAIGLVANTASRSFPVEIEIDNADGKLLPGALGRIKILTTSVENQILVPKYSILERGKGKIVFLIKDGKAVETLVQNGLEYGEYVQVIGGLNEGDQLVVSGQYQLENQIRVNTAKEERVKTKGAVTTASVPIIVSKPVEKKKTSPVKTILYITILISSLVFLRLYQKRRQKAKK